MGGINLCKFVFFVVVLLSLVVFKQIEFLKMLQLFHLDILVPPYSAHINFKVPRIKSEEFDFISLCAACTKHSS